MAAGSEDVTWSWSETQALAARAAVGAGVPQAQALAFAAMLVRHLGDGAAEAPLLVALDAPGPITEMATRIEALIEAASISPRRVTVTEPEPGVRSLLRSWLHALPCHVDTEAAGDTLTVALDLKAPTTRTRTERLTVSDPLMQRLRDLAALTYVPDSEASRAMGAGAGLMDTD